MRHTFWFLLCMLAGLVAFVFLISCGDNTPAAEPPWKCASGSTVSWAKHIGDELVCETNDTLTAFRARQWMLGETAETACGFCTGRTP